MCGWAQGEERGGSRAFAEDVTLCTGLEASRAAPIFAHAAAEGQNDYARLPDKEQRLRDIK